MAFGTGHGTTISFAVQGLVAAIRSIDGFEWSGPSADISDNETPTHRRYLPPDLVAGQPWNVVYLFDTTLPLPKFASEFQEPPNQQDPVGIETIIVQHRLGLGEAVAANWTGPGWLVRFRGPDMASNQENVAGMGVMWDGLPAFTKATLPP